MNVSGKVAAATECLRCLLASSGLRSALEWPNARTTYRYTGVYQLENDAMRMVAVFDRNSEDAKAPTVIAFGDSFCQFVMRDGVQHHPRSRRRAANRACVRRRRSLVFRAATRVGAG